MENKKIIVLGAGLVGRAIAYDLSDQFDVTSVDFNLDNLNLLNGKRPIEIIKMDFNNLDAIKSLVKDYDLVVGAAPG